jgi:hypothetical protein
MAHVFVESRSCWLGKPSADPLIVLPSLAAFVGRPLLPVAGQEWSKSCISSCIRLEILKSNERPAGIMRAHSGALSARTEFTYAMQEEKKTMTELQRRA